MDKKQKYIDRLNNMVEPKFGITPEPTEFYHIKGPLRIGSPNPPRAIITLHFNEVLMNDLHGVFFVFDDKHNTIHAKQLKQGKTWGTESTTFSLPVSEDGTEMCFKAIGLYTAKYVELTKTIYPGETDIWLVSWPEFAYNGC